MGRRRKQHWRAPIWAPQSLGVVHRGFALAAAEAAVIQGATHGSGFFRRSGQLSGLRGLQGRAYDHRVIFTAVTRCSGVVQRGTGHIGHGSGHAQALRGGADE